MGRRRKKEFAALLACLKDILELHKQLWPVGERVCVRETERVRKRERETERESERDRECVCA